MRACLQTFTPEPGAPKVGRGEEYADDHPIVLANETMFGPSSDPESAAPVLAPGAVLPDEVDDVPAPVVKPASKKKAST